MEIKHLIFKNTHRDFLLLIPILFFYILIIYFFKPIDLSGDPLGYWTISKNISNFFSDNIYNLWWGPGYPSFLSIVRVFSANFELAIYINALFLFFSSFLIKLIFNRIRIKRSLLWVYIYSFFSPKLLIQQMPDLWSEPISIFFITLIIYRLLHPNSAFNYFFIGLLLSFLMMIKLIFIYVVGISAILFFIFGNKGIRRIKMYLIFLPPIFISLLYFINTYKITNQIFYVGNSGGSALYWMSADSNVDRGDWKGGYPFYLYHENVASDPLHKYLENEKWSFFKNEIENLNWIERDRKLKNEAFKNIRDNKLKFIKNWINNLGRLFFGIPFTFHTPNWYHIIIIFKQSFLIVALSISFPFLLIYRRKIKNEVIFIFLFGLTYFFLISMFSAKPRFLFVLNPVFITLIFYVIKKFLKVNLKNIK